MIFRKKSTYPSQLDSPFQLQEHLQALYHHHTKSDHTNTTMALSRDTAQIIATPPEGIDKSLWLYELCRLLVLKANSLIVAFFDERPPCSSSTCPEMRASEWQYLCAVHDPPKSCCAIDYCCHTLDWAANVLTSQKNFPSRLTLGSETTGGSQQGIRQLTNIFRRVYRIFAHAWFQHRQSFWEVEGKEGIYILFKTVCDSYNLIPEENYTISSEAEGISAALEEKEEVKEKEKESKSILRKKEGEDSKPEETNAISTNSLAATTKRHKHTPSTGFSTIAEGGEEEELKSGSDSDASSTTSTSAPGAGKRLHKHTQSVIPAVPTIAESDEEENKTKSHPPPQQLDNVSDGTTSTSAKMAQPTKIYEPPQASEQVETNHSHQPAAEEMSEDTDQTKLADTPREGEEEPPPVPPKLEEREQEQDKLEDPPNKASEVEELKT